MRKIILSLLFMLCITSIGYAQDYRTGIGLRAGYFNGLTVKHFIAENTAVEGLFASRWHGFEITGLYEIQHHFFDVGGLNWYYGLGAHIGFWDGNYTNWGTPGENYAVIGVDGIIGLEYNFSEIPFNIGLDWKPAINIIGFTGFWADGGALSIRYIF